MIIKDKSKGSLTSHNGHPFDEGVKPGKITCAVSFYGLQPGSSFLTVMSE